MIYSSWYMSLYDLWLSNALLKTIAQESSWIEVRWFYSIKIFVYILLLTASSVQRLRLEWKWWENSGIFIAVRTLPDFQVLCLFWLFFDFQTYISWRTAIELHYDPESGLCWFGSCACFLFFLLATYSFFAGVTCWVLGLLDSDSGPGLVIIPETTQWNSSEEFRSEEFHSSISKAVHETWKQSEL